MKPRSKLPNTIPSNEQYRAQAIESFNTAQTLSEKNSKTASAYYWDCISCLSQIEQKTAKDQWHIKQSYIGLGYESKKANQAHFARFYFQQARIQQEDNGRLVTANTNIATSTNIRVSIFSIPPKKRLREEWLVADELLEDLPTKTAKLDETSSPAPRITH